MFDECISTIAGILRAPQTDDEVAHRRRFYGMDTLPETAQPRRVRNFMTRYLSRKNISRT